MPLQPDYRISAHLGKGVQNSAVNSNRPVIADSNCHLTAADTAGTDRRLPGRCCSPNTSRIETTSTKKRSNRVRLDCGKAPSDGAYPPVRPGC